MRSGSFDGEGGRTEPKLPKNYSFGKEDSHSSASGDHANGSVYSDGDRVNVLYTTPQQARYFEYNQVQGSLLRT
jgi:hypothetical protein